MKAELGWGILALLVTIVIIIGGFYSVKAFITNRNETIKYQPIHNPNKTLMEQYKSNDKAGQEELREGKAIG